jgi:hypothetical protein
MSRVLPGHWQHGRTRRSDVPVNGNDFRKCATSRIQEASGTAIAEGYFGSNPFRPHRGDLRGPPPRTSIAPARPARRKDGCLESAHGNKYNKYPSSRIRGCNSRSMRITGTESIRTKSLFRFRSIFTTMFNGGRTVRKRRPVEDKLGRLLKGGQVRPCAFHINSKKSDHLLDYSDLNPRVLFPVFSGR